MKRRNSFDRGNPRSYNNYLDNNNEQQHYTDPNKRFRNRSRSRSNTKENFEENIRLNVKQRLSINDNSNDSDCYSDSIINVNGLTGFQTTGLRITINNDKCFIHNDSNNNNIIKNDNNQNNTNCPKIVNQVHENGNIHSRIQQNPTFLNVPQNLPPLLAIPILIPPLLQPQEIKQRNFNNYINNKRDYHNNSNNITVDCKNKFNNDNNKNKNNQQNAHWNGANNNSHTKQNNIAELPTLLTINRSNTINFTNPQTKQKEDISELFEQENNLQKIIQNFDKIPVDKTKNSTPKGKTFSNCNLNAFKIQQVKNFDDEMWDDDTTNFTDSNDLDQFTSFAKEFAFNNNKTKDYQKNLSNNNFNYTDRDAPLIFSNVQKPVEMNVNGNVGMKKKTPIKPLLISSLFSTYNQHSSDNGILAHKTDRSKSCTSIDDLNIENPVDSELHVRLSLLGNKPINKISPIISNTPNIYKESPDNSSFVSTNNLIIDEDAFSQNNSFSTNNQHDSSPTTGNYSSLIELKENVFERKYNYKIFEFNIMKLKQKKLKQQQQQFNTQPNDDNAIPQPKLSSLELDHQKHDYYEINRKLQENLRKQKLLFNKASNLLNSELKVQIMNFELNKNSTLNRSTSQKNTDYFCKQCCCGFDQLNDYLNHLYTDEHQKYTGSITTAAPQSLNINGNNVFLDQLNIVEKSPLRGVEFLFPTRAFYCSLCDELCDNETLTDLHLRSVSHNNKYQELMEH